MNGRAQTGATQKRVAGRCARANSARRWTRWSCSRRTRSSHRSHTPAPHTPTPTRSLYEYIFYVDRLQIDIAFVFVYIPTVISFCIRFYCTLTHSTVLHIACASLTFLRVWILRSIVAYSSLIASPSWTVTPGTGRLLWWPQRNCMPSVLLESLCHAFLLVSQRLLRVVHKCYQCHIENSKSQRPPEWLDKRRWPTATRKDHLVPGHFYWLGF